MKSSIRFCQVPVHEFSPFIIIPKLWGGFGGGDYCTIYMRSEYHTQLAKMSFDKIFDLTAGVYFNFYNIRTD